MKTDINILVPIDFTQIAEAGLNTAINISRHLDANIHLLHVIGENNPSRLRPDGDVLATELENDDYNHFMIELIDRSRDRLNDLIRKQSAPDITFTPIIEIGDFKEKLENTIKFIPIDLVVMGTSGETAITEIYSGNHAAQVIRISDKPVLAVKKEITADQLNKILIMVDLKDHEKESVKLIKRFAEMFKMKVIIACLNKNENLIEDKLFKKLDRFAAENNFENYTLHVIDRGGKIKNINEFAEKHDINVVASISETDPGIIRLFFGSNTEKMLKKLDVPLLAITE